jgi:cytochrome P450
MTITTLQHSTDEQELPFLDVLSERFQSDPYGLLDELRQQSWLVRSPLGWTIIGFPEAREIKRDADIVRIFDAVDAERSPYLNAKAAANMSSQNGPRHIQLRRTIVQALRPRQVAIYRNSMSVIAHDLLDELVGATHADLVGQFAGPYPGLVMGPLLGVPFAEALELDDWASTINELGNHSQYDDRLPAIETAWRQMEGYLTDLIAERRKRPKGDIISDLIEGVDADDDLDEDDLLGLAMSIVNASIDNVRAQLSLTMEALLVNPQVWESFRADLSQAPALVEEGLRLFPAGDDIQHKLLRDKTIHGIDLLAGSLLFVSKKGVNRDPRLVEDPHAFRLDRATKDHLTLGFGLHACVGAILARGALAEGLLALGTRVTAWQLDGTFDRTGIESSGRPLSLPARVTVAPSSDELAKAPRQ